MGICEGAYRIKHFACGKQSKLDVFVLKENGCLADNIIPREILQITVTKI